MDALGSYALPFYTSGGLLAALSVGAFTIVSLVKETTVKSLNVNGNNMV